ncbi:MAG: hypothetical protein ACR5LA_13640 [Wolbachia sp.]
MTNNENWYKKVYTKTEAGTAFVKATELKTKAAEKDVVKAIFSAKENATDTQSILVKEVAKEPVVKEILAAKDGNKLVLVEELGKALDKVAAGDKVYGAQGSEKIAKDFLAEKGSFVKIDASNLTVAANQKAFAEAILPAKDGNKLVLVEELGKALDNPSCGLESSEKARKIG